MSQDILYDRDLANKRPFTVVYVNGRLFFPQKCNTTVFCIVQFKLFLPVLQTQSKTSCEVTNFQAAFKSMSITPELKYSCSVFRRT